MSSLSKERFSPVYLKRASSAPSIEECLPGGPRTPFVAPNSQREPSKLSHLDSPNRSRASNCLQDLSIAYRVSDDRFPNPEDLWFSNQGEVPRIFRPLLPNPLSLGPRKSNLL